MPLPATQLQRNLGLFFWAHGLLAIAFVWGRMAGDGTFALLQDATDNEHFQLPGTETALPKSFTGIGPVDQSLRSLIILFWGAVDGSSPATTAASIYFAGQIFPMAVAMYVDGLRAGNGSGLVKTSLWFELIGVAALGCVGPIWGATYTRSSPAATPSSSTPESLRAASLVTSPRAAVLLLPALTITYLGPLVLMGSSSPIVVQWAIVAWNLFPVGLVALVKSTEMLSSALIPSHQTSAASGPDQKHFFHIQKQAHLGAVRWLGALSVVFGFAVHVAVSAVSLATVLFPRLFRQEHVRGLDPVSLLTPPLALTEVSVVNDGVLGFVKWDQFFGFSVVIVVYLAQLQKALSCTRKAAEGYYGWWKCGFFAAISSLVLGPGTTIMGVSWLRDEILYSL